MKASASFSTTVSNFVFDLVKNLLKFLSLKRTYFNYFLEAKFICYRHRSCSLPDFHQRLGRGHEQGMEGGEGSPEGSGWKYLFYGRGTSQPAPRIFSPAPELPSQSLKIKYKLLRYGLCI